MAEIEKLTPEERAQLTDSVIYDEQTGRKVLRIIEQQAIEIVRLNEALEQRTTLRPPPPPPTIPAPPPGRYRLVRREASS